MRNRWYDPNSGRFTQEDPIGYAGGVNLYGYVGNDPVSYNDPFGLCKPWPECWADLVAAMGAARGDWVGAVMLNGAAAVNAAMDLGINQIGEALGEGDIRGTVKAGVLAFFAPGEGKAASHLDDLISEARRLYPSKAGRTEFHHIVPKYLGGSASGVTVRLDAAYHQMITNEFRRLWPYGQSVSPSAAQLQQTLGDVYTQFPLPSR